MEALANMLGVGELYRMDKRQVCYHRHSVLYGVSIIELTPTFLYTHMHVQLFYQLLNFGMIVSSALMIWKGLMVVTGSESPIVVVLRYTFV